MNRKWLAAFSLVLGLGFDALGDQFIFQAVPANVVAQFNSNSLSYYSVANSGTNFYCVGSNSVASLAGTNIAPPLGGYLTNVATWGGRVVPATNVNLYAATYGANLFLAAGSGNATFTNAGGAWGSSGKAITSVNVDADGLAYNSPAKSFAMVTASYQAEWAPSSIVWTNAPNTSNTTAVVESFRAVTTMGGSNLALCGIRGDIRISPDGGHSWNLSREFNFSAPDLYAITSDGSNTLVCAGAGGAVLVSTNGGGVWVTNIITMVSNSIPLTNASVFYAATYTGGQDNQFLLADANGRIFMATNNPVNSVLSWYQATNVLAPLPTKTLRGATVALTGPMAGIAMLVGDTGTIIVGGTRPPVPTPVNNTNCALQGLFGSCPNPALSAIVNGDSYHPTSDLVADWFVDAAGSGQLTNNSPSFVPTNSMAGSYTYYVRTRDIRTGLVSPMTNVVFKVNALPFAPAVAGYASGVTAWVTNVLSSAYQTNTPLVADVSTNLVLIATNTPGAWVTVDWYTTDVDQSSYRDALAGGFAATGGVTNWDASPGWNNGFGLVLKATNTLVFHPTNRVSGTYTYYARARVINTNYDSSYSGCVCQSTNLTMVMFRVIPPLPTGSVWATNCALQNEFGECGNPALTVTLLTNFDYPPRVLTADWYTVPSGGAAVANGTLTYYPPNTAAGSYTNFVETHDVANGYVSTNRLPVVFTVNALPYAPVVAAAWVTNELTSPNQVNTPLVADVSASANLIATNAPGAWVTVDWYTADVSSAAYAAGLSSVAVGGVASGDSGWAGGTGLLVATNTLVFHPTNRVTGTYYYYARARVINPNFIGCVCQSTNLTMVTLTVIPPKPTGATGVTNCALQTTFGSCDNPALTVTVLTNWDYPPRVLTADWYAAAAGGTPVTNATLSFIPPDTAAGSYTYYAQTRDPVNNYVSTNRTPVVFKVNALPLAPTVTVAYVTNELTQPYQTNLVLTADVSGSTNLIATNSPGAIVTVDWYTTNVDETSYTGAAAIGGQTNVDTGWASGVGLVVGTNTLVFYPTNRLGGTYTYWARARVIDPHFTGCVCQSTNLAPVEFHVLPPMPTNAIVGLTNVLSQPATPLWVDIQINSDNPPGNFVVDWFADEAGTINLNNGTETNLNNRFFHTATNCQSGVYTIWAQTRATNTSPAGVNVVSTNKLPVTFVLIPPAPLNPQNGTNCAGALLEQPAVKKFAVQSGCPNPTLSVQLWVDPLGCNSLAANWYDGSGTPVATDTLNYVPLDTTPGTYTYWVETQSKDSGLVSTNRLAVLFKVNALPYAPVVLTATATNVLTAPYQTNGSLAVSVDLSTNLIAMDSPGATVTADWYLDAGGLMPASTATNSADANWLTGGGVIPATNTLVFYPTNRICGAYTYYARARVINPNFSACACLSTTLTPVVFTVIPPLPTGGTGATNCALQNQFAGCANPALMATVLTNFDYPPSVLTADWYDAATGGNLVTNTTLAFIPANATAGGYTYYVQARDAATGLISTSRLPVVFKVNALPAAPVAAAPFVKNELTAPYQTNTALTVDVSGTTNLIALDSPGATVAVDWYLDAAGTIPASTGTNNADTNWLAGGGVVPATNTLVFIPTNRICGSYTNWARARVMNPNFTGCVCQSTNLTPVVFTILPPIPTGSMGATNCALMECPNPALMVTVLTNPDYPPGILTVDWFDAAAGGNQVTNATLAFIPTNAVAGSYTYFAQTRDVTSSFISTSRLPVVFKVNALPLAPLAVTGYVTNVLGAPYQTNATLVVDASNSTNLIASDATGATVTVDWYVDAAGMIPAIMGTNTASADWLENNGLVSATNTLVFHPTNRVCGIYTNWARTRVINPNFTGCVCQSTNLTPVVFKIIPPLPTGGVGATNCALAECANPALTVSVLVNSTYTPGKLTADWFDGATDPIPVATATLSFAPANTAVGSYTYYAQTRDPVTGYVSTNRLPVVFKVNPLPLAPVAVTLGVTNVLTAASQTNLPLWVSVDLSTNLIATNALGATVTADWYADAAGTVPATMWNASWVVIPATNTLAFNPTNRLCGTYTNWARARVINPAFTGCTCQSTNLTPVVFHLIPPAPTNAIVGLTNVLSQPATPLWVEILTNADNPPANFAVDWFADAARTVSLNNGTETNLNGRFFHSPTNYCVGIYTVWAQTRATNTSPEGVNVVSTNLTPVTFVQIPPAPGNPQGATNCAGEACANPALSVQVPGDACHTLTANWYDGFGEPLAAGTHTNAYTPTDNEPGTYTYWVETVEPVSGLVSTNRVAVTFKVNQVPLAPVAAISSITNVLADPQINGPLVVSVANSWDNITNDSPGAVVTADWYLDMNGLNVAPTWTTNVPTVSVPATNTLAFYPTNVTAGIYTYWVRARVINPSFTYCICQSTALTPVTYTVVPPAPTSLGNQTSCAGVTNPALSVTVFGSAQVNWFDAQSGGNQVATNLLSFTATNALSGSYNYWAEALDAASGLTSTNRTKLTLTLQDCPLSSGITLLPGSVSISWFGNLYLQSATNLVPPVQWNVVTQGVPGANNSWTNTIFVPPALFFRLSPTN